MTSKRAIVALAERAAASPDFAKSLQWPDAPGEGEGDYIDEDNQGDEVVYDEIDSSRTIDEETLDLILQQSRHPLAHEPDADSDHNDHQIVGANMERYTGHEFSSHTATNSWMDWDASSHT